MSRSTHRRAVDHHVTIRAMNSSTLRPRAMRSLNSRHLEVCALGQCRARSWRCLLGSRSPRPGATRSRHPRTLPANSCRCLHQAGRISRVLRLGSSKVSDEEWEKTLSTNISAMFYIVKAAVAHMPEGSSIINTASVNPDAPVPIFWLTLLQKARFRTSPAGSLSFWPRKASVPTLSRPVRSGRL